MKTKHRTCVAAAAAAAATGATEKMKSVILYPYGPLTGTGCCRMLHAKNLAITSAIYTINISLLIVLIYSWRINVNIRKSGELEDVYYGVQIAYFAIIGTQMSMIALSVMLIFGIYKENPGLIVPWIIGYITFMALEAVAMVYSNVLRDHVNKQFDAMCKAEVAFFIARALINVVAMWGVLRFYNLVRAGITWNGPEVIELRNETHDSPPIGGSRLACSSKCHLLSHYQSQAKMALTSPASRGYHQQQQRHCHDDDCKCKRQHGESAYKRRENQMRTTGCCFFDLDDYDDDDECDEEEGDYYYGDDDDYDDYYDYVDVDEEGDCSMLGGAPIARHNRRYSHHQQQQHQYRPRNNNIRSVLINKRHHKYKITQPQTRLEVINESERSAGSGSDENDSLLVAYDSASSLASV